MADKILVVDDEPEIADLVEVCLKNEGYEIWKCYSAEDALACIEKREFDLGILDIMLPHISGFELCRRIRQHYTYPVIMLTAKDEEGDKIMGLTLGADDYITKPFRPLEMVARVKAVLRRSTPQQDARILSHGNVVMNLDEHSLMVRGERVELTLKEFDMLRMFMQHPGIVFTRDQLLSDIWGVDYDGETRTIDVHIRTLRQKLGQDGNLISTVRGVGYRLEERI